ncbi:hypothetical protein Tco_1125087 [Tanacetum coccineum]|uniref:Uncharacterized protein n=1 Tax=Tanacetum coccineum TaxID=301880 RepID=A0ABQ5JAU7_9ASTR
MLVLVVLKLFWYLLIKRCQGKEAQMIKRISMLLIRLKKKIRQEEAGLEEAIRLQAQMDEEVAKQIHLDKMLAKKVQEEQELSEQQLKRKAEVQKNQELWKTAQLKKLSFEELKTEFEKLMKSIESFVSMESEEMGKDEVVKEEEAEVPVKKTGMRRKQKAKKRININNCTR